MLVELKAGATGTNASPLGREQGGGLAAANAHGAQPVAASGAALVRITDVSKQYLQGKVKVDALRGVSLSIAKGEMLAICGPSGSGKSTLLNLIGMLDQPDHGHVWLAGHAVTELSENARADLRSRMIGFIFQSFNLVPVLSALENVLLPLTLRGALKAGDKERAQGLLVSVGLAKHMGAYPDRMSGGQRQRVAIARALITGPQLVVADEPTANLDSENSLMVMDLIADLRDQSGTTFVFSTHDDRVLGHMSRTVQLRDGVLAQGEQ